MGIFLMLDAIIQREIRWRMKASGYNQKSLARAAELNETAIRDILKGRSRNPRIDTLKAIATVLQCTVNDLVGDTELRGEIQRLRERVAAVESELSAKNTARPGGNL